jgi:hypothetical protein
VKILLDIDGVLLAANSWKVPELLADGFPDFKPNAVRNLLKIISATGAQIILSSSHKANFSIPEWENIFRRRGLALKVDTLAANTKHLSRKDEILHWLAQNPMEHFVIIDDDSSLNDLPLSLKKRLVLTRSFKGLTEKEAEDAIKILQLIEVPIS